MKTDFDIIIIGGGINGAGIARDASGKGYNVALFEMNDLASATSSWSTKLIHGGLRYMEQYQFRLVRESLIERENLMDIAPHIIRPLRFILPHSSSLRPFWLIRLGLFFYDNIIKRKYLPSSKSITFKIICKTAVIILEPPGEPIARNGSPLSKTIVGVIELNGLLAGSISLAIPPNNPN